MKFNFSAMGDKQVALLRMDALSGDVLDDKFELFLTDKQKAYTIFESVEEAKAYIQSALKPMRTIEAVVYNRAMEVIFDYEPIKRN